MWYEHIFVEHYIRWIESTRWRDNEYYDPHHDLFLVENHGTMKYYENWWDE